MYATELSKKIVFLWSNFGQKQRFAYGLTTK
jgi:hypothetical protein